MTAEDTQAITGAGPPERRARGDAPGATDPLAAPESFGPYVLLRSLGRGAMGDVHLARPVDPDRGIPTPVVVKRLHGELADKRGFVARFRHEAAIAVAVDSPHVVKVYDAGAVGGVLYFAMEHVPGWPLTVVIEEILRSGRHASIPSILDALEGVLEGLAALHGAVDPATGAPLGIVHRDLSPKNLMVGEDGLVRIIDLGLGKSKAQGWKTRTGIIMGSIGYIPPEQAAGEHVDHRADLYALGVVAYELVALRSYIKRGQIAEMVAESMSPTYHSPAEVRPDVPPALDAFLERLLRRRPEERFQTASEALVALRKIAPARAVRGQLAALVGELFGATRAERARELAALVGRPVLGEGEHEPTEVFAKRAGVRPEAETQVVRARRRPAEDTEVAVPTVATVAVPSVAGARRGVPGALPGAPGRGRPGLVSVRGIDPRVAVIPVEDTLPPAVDPTALAPEPQLTRTAVDPTALAPEPLPTRTAIDPTALVPEPLPTRTVALGRPGAAGATVRRALVLAIAAAALIGAVSAVGLRGLGSAPKEASRARAEGTGVRAATSPDPTEPREAAEPTPTAVPLTVHAAPSTNDVGPEVRTDPMAEPKAEPRPTRPREPARGEAARSAERRVAGRTPAVADRAPDRAPTREPAPGDELRALLGRVDALIARLPPGPRRDRALELKLDLRRDQTISDPGRLRDVLPKARAELASLERE